MTLLYFTWSLGLNPINLNIKIVRSVQSDQCSSNSDKLNAYFEWDYTLFADFISDLSLESIFLLIKFHSTSKNSDDLTFANLFLTKSRLSLLNIFKNSLLIARNTVLLTTPSLWFCLYTLLSESELFEDSNDEIALSSLWGLLCSCSQSSLFTESAFLIKLFSCTFTVCGSLVHSK